MCRLARLLVIAWTVIPGLALLSNAGVAKAACPEVGFTIVEPHASSLTRPVRVGRTQVLFVRRKPITATSDIVDIRLVADTNDDATLRVKFTAAGTQRLHDATTNHAGRRIAFMFDDEVLINVLLQGPHGSDADGVEVSMQHGMKHAQELMKALRGCVPVIAGDLTP